MRFFSKILPIALVAALLVPAAFANEGIYDRDLVRGFISPIKGGFRSMESDGVKFINMQTGKSYSQDYWGGQFEIGAEYHQLRTWFDVDFMITEERSDTEWFAYGITWMWGYKLFPKQPVNLIISAGPGIELMNIRRSEQDRLESSFGLALTAIEIEPRLQLGQFSVGLYYSYKVVRHDWDNWSRELSSDKQFAGIKLSWTMLNNYQKKENDLK